MEADALVREYYRCLDEDDYGSLRSILHPDFVQQRPDRRFTDREQFVTFMETGRPMTDTRHEIDTVLESADSLAAAGRLYDTDGNELFAFIDVFGFDGEGRIAVLDTHS